jgi:hypothetical protein
MFPAPLVSLDLLTEKFMVRISKQEERRAKCPHRPRPPAVKTGSKKDNLNQGYKPHANVVEDAQLSQKIFIPKRIG